MLEDEVEVVPMGPGAAVTLPPPEDMLEPLQERYSLAPEVVGQIYERFLMGNLTLKELALEHGVPVRVVVTLAKKNGWVERKHELELEAIEKAEASYRDFVIKNKLPTAEEQLAASRSIVTKLQEILATIDTSGGDPTSKLRRIAEALKSAADVGARATGMSDAPMSDYIRNREQTQKQTPIVVVGINATRSTGR